MYAEQFHKLASINEVSHKKVYRLEGRIDSYLTEMPTRFSFEGYNCKTTFPDSELFFRAVTGEQNKELEVIFNAQPNTVIYCSPDKASFKAWHRGKGTPTILVYRIEITDPKGQTHTFQKEDFTIDDKVIT